MQQAMRQDSMKRIILDTNIYGLIVEDPERDIVKSSKKKLSSEPDELMDCLDKIRVFHRFFYLMPYILFFWFFEFHIISTIKPDI